MVFSLSNRANLQLINRPLCNTQVDGTRELDTAQMFRLLDSILCFEACLYHQVLPLTLEGSRLKLGMVNPEDTVAVNYFRRILSYMNCSLVSQPIGASTHQAMLSAYLSYRESNPATKPSLAASHPAAQVAAKSLGQEPTRVDQNDQPTFILANTEALNFPKAAQVDFHTQSAVQATCLDSAVEVLATLPPKKLLQELLGRVLAGGIGRVYFERQFAQGRIVWSHNGVLQTVLEQVPLPVFQGVLDELKRLTHLPLDPVQEPKQVEIECFYQQNRLLLRLRVMPEAHGEEATLQVLRGAALKFYEQRQLPHLSRDALAIAQQLQRKVNELRRAHPNPSLSYGQLETLPALKQLLESLNQEMEALKHPPTQQALL